MTSGLPLAVTSLRTLLFESQFEIVIDGTRDEKASQVHDLDEFEVEEESSGRTSYRLYVPSEQYQRAQGHDVYEGEHREPCQYQAEYIA